MGRLRALATATLLLAAFPGLAATAGEGADRDALLGKGMEQHDAGSFKSAIESF